MIQDTFLINLAKLTNDEVAVNPTHEAYTSSVIVPDPTDTSTVFAGEFTRTVASGSRTTNAVTFSSVKSGATLGSSTETVNAVGLFNASTSGELLAEALVPSLVHTSDFDVETDWTLTFERKN